MSIESTTPTLRLDSEVDMLNAEAVHAEGRQLLTDADMGASLVIDMEAVTFLDSAALNALVQLRLDAIDRDGDVVLQNVPERTASLLRIAGLAELFTTQ